MIKGFILIFLVLGFQTYAYDAKQLHELEDIYIIDMNKDGQASIETLIQGEDAALVLIYEPALIDVIKGSPYGKKSFVFLGEAGFIYKLDTDRDITIGPEDVTYGNLGLFHYNKKTGHYSITSLKDLQATISIPKWGKGLPALINKNHQIYQIKYIKTHES